MTNYSYNCPYPCNYQIKVDAENRDDAIRKIMAAGAMSCRNLVTHYYCERTNLNLYPIPEDELKNIVNLCMQVGD